MARGPQQVFEELRALDRRLLALAGDLHDPLQHAGSLHAPRVVMGGRRPYLDELSRLTIEVEGIAHGLVAIATAHALPCQPRPDLKVSQTHAGAAYSTLRERATELRDDVRRALEAWASRHPELADDHSRLPSVHDMLDPDEWVESVESPARAWLRRNYRVGLGAIGTCIVGWLGCWAAASTRADVLEVARHLCSKPPPCAGDTPEIAASRRRTRPRAVERRGRGGLVLHRRSADCSYEVEVYFDFDGNFDFRGSLEDPDVERRTAFAERRRQWHELNRMSDPVSCSNVDQLWW